MQKGQSTSTNKNIDFRFYTDNFSIISKAKDEQGKEVMRIGGIASTEDLDAQNEILVIDGMQIDRLVGGLCNWQHQSLKDPSSIIGTVSKAEKRKGQGLYLECDLFTDHQKARDVYDLTKRLDKANTNQKMAFSIEGRAIERDPLNNKRVTKSIISGVAATPTPINRNTFAQIIKGEVSLEDSIEEPVFEKSESNKIIDVLDNQGNRIIVDDSYNIKIEKARKASIGEIRTWSNGKKYQKTTDGWKPVSDKKLDNEKVKEKINDLLYTDEYDNLVNLNTLDTDSINDINVPNYINDEQEAIQYIFKKLNIPFTKNVAGTGTYYYGLNLKNDENFKLRVANHSKGSNARFNERQTDGNIEFDDENFDIYNLKRKLIDELPHFEILIDDDSLADNYFNQKEYKGGTKLTNYIDNILYGVNKALTTTSHSELLSESLDKKVKNLEYDNEEDEEKEKKVKKSFFIDDENSNFTLTLEKSQIYDYFLKSIPDLSIGNAKRLYQTIETLIKSQGDTMSDLTQEKLEKAFAVLNTLSEKSDELIKGSANGGEMTRLDMMKSCYDKGMAKDDIYKAMKDKYEDMSDDEMEKMYESNFAKKKDDMKKGEETESLDDQLAKAEAELEALKIKKAEELKKGEEIKGQLLETSGTEYSDLIKGLLSEFEGKFNDKFNAVGEILKGVVTENDNIKKLLSEKEEEIKKGENRYNELANQAQKPKSITATGYIEKGTQPNEFSNSNAMLLDSNNPQQRQQIIAKGEQLINWDSVQAGNLMEKSFAQHVDNFAFGTGGITGEMIKKFHDAGYQIK